MLENQTTFNEKLRESLSNYYFSGNPVGEEEQLLEKWYSYHVSGLDRGRKVAYLFSKFVDLNDKHMLEIGCGCGGLTTAFSERGCIATGLDNNSTLPNLTELAKIRAKENYQAVSFIEGTSESLPFDSKSFDIVFCDDVLEHVGDINATLDEICRVVKDDGFIFLRTLDRFSPFVIMNEPHYNLPFITLFPVFLSKFLVVKLLKKSKNYSVSEFPTHNQIIRKFKRNGIDYFNFQKNKNQIPRKLNNLEEINNPSKKLIMRLISSIGLKKYLVYFSKYPWFLGPLNYFASPSPSVTAEIRKKVKSLNLKKK